MMIAWRWREMKRAGRSRIEPMGNLNVWDERKRKRVEHTHCNKVGGKVQHGDVGQSLHDLVVADGTA